MSFTALTVPTRSFSIPSMTQAMGRVMPADWKIQMQALHRHLQVAVDSVQEENHHANLHAGDISDYLTQRFPRLVELLQLHLKDRWRHQVDNVLFEAGFIYTETHGEPRVYLTQQQYYVVR